MKIIIHKNCNVGHYKAMDGREIIYWGLRYSDSLNETFLNELQDAIDHQKAFIR